MRDREKHIFHDGIILARRPLQQANVIGIFEPVEFPTATYPTYLSGRQQCATATGTQCPPVSICNLLICKGTRPLGDGKLVHFFIAHGALAEPDVGFQLAVISYAAVARMAANKSARSSSSTKVAAERSR